ncbi:hypothetical protein SDJN03_22973, partial [Cucurbita argyrosperma subsp. sororia]
MFSVGVIVCAVGLSFPPSFNKFRGELLTILIRTSASGLHRIVLEFLRFGLMAGSSPLTPTDRRKRLKTEEPYMETGTGKNFLLTLAYLGADSALGWCVGGDFFKFSEFGSETWFNLSIS